MTSASVVVPVRDGERYLEELLAALADQEPGLEVLVVDSGSRDRSVAIARAAGVDVVQIPPGDFGHGRTRNLGAERTSGELVCFLTQDATPVPGWLAAYREAFALADRVGAAYGPHLPRPDTSPMIARELTEFFAGFSPDGRPVVQGPGDDPFLSNVNACYARACWEEVRFRDLPYAEDQAFARDMLAAGWSKAYHPGAAVLHAHDYGPVTFMRRYFDEYRGLRQTIGHVEPRPGVRSTSRLVRAQVAGDRRWLRERGAARAELARWTARSAVHWTGRSVFSALGSRHDRLPPAVERAISLEGRADPRAEPGPGDELPPIVDRPARGSHPYQAVARVARDGPARLLEAVPGMSERERLHVAVAIPPFKRGSGGHGSIFQIVRRLEERGHTCSIWLDDPLGLQDHEWPAVVRRGIQEHFAPIEAPVFKGFGSWYGADVAVATGWQTAHPVALLDACRARAYLVHDHEPEFYATSAERHWAADTYRLDLFCIAASPWLRDLLVERYGRSATTFEFGVDHDTYVPRPVERRRDTVVLYARTVTPRRAVELATLALGELRGRRPGVRLVLYGNPDPLDLPYDHEDAGIASPTQLSWLYSQATVGVCLSMTNYSLVPQEMLACGLPCVDLAGPNNEAVYGTDGPVELVEFDPVALADAIERLLDDEERWTARSEAGREFVLGRTWSAAGDQVEAGLRAALREREAAS